MVCTRIFRVAMHNLLSVYIAELINIPKKTTMSAFTMQLWNFIDKRVEILSNELVDVLLQYLSARTKAFKHDQVSSVLHHAH